MIIRFTLKPIYHKKNLVRCMKIYIREDSREILAIGKAILSTRDILVCSILRLNAICSGSVKIRQSFATIPRLFIAEVNKLQRVSGPCEYNVNRGIRVITANTVTIELSRPELFIYEVMPVVLKINRSIFARKKESVNTSGVY